MPYLHEAIVVHAVGRQPKPTVERQQRQGKHVARWCRSTWLSIRDPFDFDHDLGTSLSEQGWRRVWSELRWAYDTLLHTANVRLVIHGGMAGQPRRYTWQPTDSDLYGHGSPRRVHTTAAAHGPQRAAEERRWQQWEELQRARAAGGKLTSLALPESDVNDGEAVAPAPASPS